MPGTGYAGRSPGRMRLCHWLATLALLGAAPQGLALAAPPEAEISQGAALVKARNCLACHSLGGKGAKVGPALDQVTLRRPEDWLRRWLADPAAMKRGTLMPEFDWSEAQYKALFAYLGSFRTPVDGAGILRAEGVNSRSGRKLVQAYQCGACHRVDGLPGLSSYPDLNTVAKRHDAAWERQWLRDPQAVKPGTFMPKFPFSAAEIEAITAYLYP